MPRSRAAWGLMLELVLADARRSLVQPIRVAEVGVVEHVPVHVGPPAVHAMPGLGRQAEELEALLPEKVVRLPHVPPRHLHVADRPIVPVLGVERNAVVVGSDVRIGADDHVGQIRGGLRTFPVHDEVLAVLDRLGQVGVGVQPARIGVERLVVMHLLVERDARVGSEVQQSAARAAVAGRP